MNVTNTFNINFKGNIIDSHVHVGTFNGNVYTKDHLDILKILFLHSQERSEL